MPGYQEKSQIRTSQETRARNIDLLLQDPESHLFICSTLAKSPALDSDIPGEWRRLQAYCLALLNRQRELTPITRIFVELNQAWAMYEARNVKSHFQNPRYYAEICNILSETPKLGMAGEWKKYESYCLALLGEKTRARACIKIFIGQNPDLTIPIMQNEKLVREFEWYHSAVVESRNKYYSIDPNIPTEEEQKTNHAPSSLRPVVVLSNGRYFFNPYSSVQTREPIRPTSFF